MAVRQRLRRAVFRRDPREGAGVPQAASGGRGSSPDRQHGSVPHRNRREKLNLELLDRGIRRPRDRGAVDGEDGVRRVELPARGAIRRYRRHHKPLIHHLRAKPKPAVGALDQVQRRDLSPGRSAARAADRVAAAHHGRACSGVDLGAAALRGRRPPDHQRHGEVLGDERERVVVREPRDGLRVDRRHHVARKELALGVAPRGHLRDHLVPRRGGAQPKAKARLERLPGDGDGRESRRSLRDHDRPDHVVARGEVLRERRPGGADAGPAVERGLRHRRDVASDDHRDVDNIPTEERQRLGV
eukprot:m.194709 g.194709  ORF g.194709 m.194709 type:complete len:301 (+) comp15217_c0_seq1:800-1702(+)